MPGILVGAEASRLPFAALLANVYVRPTPGLPPFGTGWSPARGVWARVATRWPGTRCGAPSGE